MKIGFEISQIIDNDKFITKIINKTTYNCIIQIRPIPPKRKYDDVFLIKNDTYIIIDQEPLELTRIAIIFEEI
jgi:hypothetical protein